MTVQQLRQALFNIDNQALTITELRWELFNNEETPELRQALFNIDNQALTITELRSQLFDIQDQNTTI